MIIGLDAASPPLIERWIDRLPNLRTLYQSGTHGTLLSIVPPSSVPAWQCFATGKNPAKIGVWGFLSIGPDRKLRHARTPQDIGCIWDICGNAGFKVGVFNVPGTYPPYPVNGFMVSGFPVPTRKVWSSPPELMDRINSAVGGYEIDVPLTKPTEMKGGEKAYLPVVRRLHDKSLQTAKLLIEWYNPDLFVMTLQGIDLVHHDFWKYMDNPDSPYANVLRDWYINMDDAVGELRKLVGADTSVLLLSDHGSAPVSSALFVNKYLESNGLLKVKGHVKNKGDTYTKVPRWDLKNMPPGMVAGIYKITPDFVSHKLTASAAIERTLQGMIGDVDCNKTLALSSGVRQAHISVNYDLVDKLKDNQLSQTVDDLVKKLCNMMNELIDLKKV